MRMNRSKYVSLTGISSILTAHCLPVSAQVAPTPVNVHFVPQQIVHSPLAQTQAHSQAQNQAQTQVHVHHQSTQDPNQSSSLHHLHGTTADASQKTDGGAPGSTPIHHNALNSNVTQSPSQTTAPAADQTSSPATHHGFFSHHQLNMDAQTAHHGNVSQTNPTTQSNSANQASSGFSFFHHGHHNTSVANQNVTTSGHATQIQSQQQLPSTVITATVAPREHHLQWQNNGPVLGNSVTNLDLGSSAQVATLSHQLNNLLVTINVGGAQMQVTNTTQLTAAEKVAALQVISTGQQSLILDAKGTADGGNMTITPWLANHLGNLVIPSGVSVSDVSKTGTLTVHGSLIDSGNLYVTSANPAATAVSLSASNIAINSGGLLSDVSPTAATAATAAIATANNPVNFNISSLNSITNAGTINSSGALVLNASNAIVNASQINVAQGTDLASAGVIHALNDITMTSGSGAITNGGLVSSSTGNITLASASPSTALNINGTNGTFQAQNGAINIQPASYAGSAQTNINGGNYLSQQLNLNGGAGAVNANIGQVTGIVNTVANDVHFTAASSALQLGNMDISGDPTYYNSQGPATLVGVFTVAGDLAVVTRGDIISAVPLTATAGSGQAGNITLIAGATFSATPPAQGNDSTTVITLSNASPPDIGGSVQITSDLTSSGNITVVAYKGSMSSGSIDITGTTKTSGGNVTLIAGATSGTGITTGDIQTYGTGSAGNVTLLTATPVISGAGALTILNGTMTGGYTTTGLPTNNASITTGNILAAGNGGAPVVNGGNGGVVNLTAGSTLTSGYIRAYGGGGGGGQDQFSQAGSGGDGGSVVLRSSNAITVNGDINTSGGGGGGGYITLNGQGGSGGTVDIAGSTIVTVNGPILAASGGTGGSAVPGNIGGAAGGGSFGGGGGAGYTYPPHKTGGGGGGIFGGGGSGDGSLGSNLAAGSGGGVAGGAGGIANGSPGSAGSGGNGANAPANGGIGGVFGQPGTSFGVLPATGVGASASTGGTVKVTAGQAVLITKTVGDLGGVAYAGSFANESIDARGTGSSIDVKVLSPISSSYLEDAKYDAGASTYLAPTAGVYSKGDWTATTIKVTTPSSTFIGAANATAAQVSIGGSTETLLEGTSNVVVNPGALVTPAEYIAFIQAANGGQTLQLGQTAVGTTPGTGYATGGSFAVTTANLPSPSGSFTNLVLPANVIESVSIPSLTYTGSGSVSGTINTTGTMISFGTDLNLLGNGAINFNAPTGGTLTAGDSITGSGTTLISVSNPAGTLNLTTTSTTPGSGNIQVNTGTANLQISSTGSAAVINNQAVQVLASTAATDFGVQATSGDLTIAGNINAGNRLGLQTDQAGKSILESSGTLTAAVTAFNSAGDIGQPGNPILTDAPRIVVQTNGSVFVNDSISASLVQSSASTLTSGIVTETGAGQTLKLGDSTDSAVSIRSTGNFVATATGAGGSIVADNSITVTGAGAKIDLSTTGSGGITQTTGNLTADKVVLSTGSLATAGGAIGTIAVVAPSVAVGTYAVDTTSGSATITNTTAGASSIGTTSAVNNLSYTATGAGTSIGINPVNAKGTVTISDVSGTSGGIVINGDVNAGSFITLKAAGSGLITEGTTGGTLTANSVGLLTGGGDIGTPAQNGAILTSASTVYLGTDPSGGYNGNGSAYVQDAISAQVYARNDYAPSNSIYSLVFTDLGSSISALGYLNGGDVTLQGVGQNNTSITGVVIQGVANLTLTATGTGGIDGFAQDFSTTLNTTSGNVNFQMSQTPGGVNLNIGGTGVSVIQPNDYTYLNGTVAGTLQLDTGGFYPIIIGNLQVGSGLSTISGGSISVGTLTATGGGSVKLSAVGSYFATTGISGGGTITASSVQLVTPGYDIGAAGQPIHLVTPEFSASANNVYLSNTGNATVDSFTFSGTQGQLSNLGTLNILALTGTNASSQDIRADISASGAITVGGPIAITASANSKAMLQFAGTTSGGPVTVINNAAITAHDQTADGGIIAFNGGATGQVSLTGTGTVNADTYVAFGNIDPTTLVPINGQVIPNTATFVNGNGLVSFSQSAPLGNQIIVAPLVAPPPPPQPPVVVVIPTGGGGAKGGLGDSFFGLGGFGIPIATTASDILNQNNTANQANLAAQLAFAERLVQQLFFDASHANPNLLRGNPFITLNEQIGTRLATDYTPNVFPATRKSPDLEGGIEIIQKLAEIPGQAIFGVSEFNANELSSLANHGVQFGQNSKDQYLSLLKGFVLFAPDKDITVEVREGTVYIPKGCIAWVMETGADSAIYDLHDSISTGAVRVVVNNKEIKMGPGTQLLLTRDMKSSFEQLNPGSSVGYRNIRSTDMGNGIKSFVADFSIAHGLENLEVLHSLFYSQDPKNRKLVAQMLKNAAILADLTGGSGAYRTSASR